MRPLSNARPPPAGGFFLRLCLAPWEGRAHLLGGGGALLTPEWPLAAVSLQSRVLGRQLKKFGASFLVKMYFWASCRRGA